MEVRRLSGLDLQHSGEVWRFSVEHRTRIDRHWQDLIGRHPHLWNGEVLICLKAAVENDVLRGAFARTDYASFIAWRDWGTPDALARNCFGCPIVLTSDRAIIFGEMASNTLNGGKIYPPSGSLEPRDIKPDGAVDVLGSIAIELAEETGLDAALAKKGGLVAIFDQHRLAVCQVLAFELTAEDVQRHFDAHSDPEKELTRLIAIRPADEISGRMPSFAQEIVRRFDDWFEGH